MGWLFQEATASIALVGIDAAVTKRLRPILLKSGADDPGKVELHSAADLAECRVLLDKLTSICINVSGFTAESLVGFVGDVRTTHPLIAFCLVGTGKVLEQMSGFHQNWRERFQHYLQLKTDIADTDFEQNVGAIRDLLIADVVKARGLGRYETTPGKVIKLKAAIPYGYWIALIASVITTLVAALIGPMSDRYFPKHESASQTSVPNNQATKDR